MMALAPAARPGTVEETMEQLDRMQARVEDAWAVHHLTSRGQAAASRPGRGGRALSQTPLRRHVLIADDDRFQRKLIRGLVEGTGCSCDAVESAEGVLDWLQEHRSPDALIIDVLMPGMDGISLLRRLRQQGYGGPIIVCSGLTSADVRSEVEDHGIVKYVNKAKDIGLIPELLHKLLGRLPR